ncbi:MAG: helix-turn-helix transcriptional regulator [Mycobacterium kyogaense]|uniref:helix-turn-helix transcriptional regulator n=1 Tax=Mycobacterium kyogaense TaxID=2212479 RepID=UPI002FF69031
MVSTATFSHLVSQIYAAAVTPSTWDAAICELHAALVPSTTGTGTVRSTALAFTDGTQRTVVGQLLPDAERPYREYYGRIDHVLHAVEQGAVGVVRTGDELVTARRATEFHNDWIRPNDIEAGLFVRLTRGSLTASLIVAGSRRRHPFATGERRRFVTALVPHLQQAIATQRHIAGLSERAAHLAGAVDSLPHGVVVVSADRLVVEANSVAQEILAQRDGLAVTAGSLEASTNRLRGRLTMLIDQALAPGLRSGGSLTCERPSGRASYVVHVVPVDAAVAGVGGRPAAMVLIIDPARETRPAAEVLRQLFGMSPAEATVACLALHGLGVPAISEQLNLSSSTIRTHLRAIFTKTGTHRQAELVRLLSTVIPG